MMLTNFEKCRDDLDRMDGQSQEEMHSALRDWMSLAHEQRALLWRFAHLKEVLTIEDIPRVQSANLILRQIADHVTELREFFSRTPASNVLQGAMVSLESDLADAERFTRQIMKFVPEVLGTTAGKAF
ncbi:hypothetical protein RBU55_01005 [Pseudomonas chlororaphis subsp. aurantiaca]|uniref:hypothetical protein n=1 Tax=Pseudomonas chlororaphis TaxID=587753 RepID=UPI0027DE76CB|nr:hypothetical protein [Pseudomonas chlororaphis]WMJ00163.1 hypothetical protein RBU55_01005 [Pseudomonas chlororaphis subsp. aurantiaca]